MPRAGNRCINSDYRARDHHTCRKNELQIACLTSEPTPCLFEWKTINERRIPIDQANYIRVFFSSITLLRIPTRSGSKISPHLGTATLLRKSDTSESVTIHPN